MSTTYNENLAREINSFLGERKEAMKNWNYSFDNTSGRFDFIVPLPRGSFKNIVGEILVLSDDYIVYFYSPISVEVANGKLAIIAEFICRANYGLRNGNFELDLRDGEIRYKSFVTCRGITPTQEMIQYSIVAPGAMFMQYGTGFVDILFGNATAEEAVVTCEKDLE